MEWDKIRDIILLFGKSRENEEGQNCGKDRQYFAFCEMNLCLKKSRENETGDGIVIFERNLALLESFKARLWTPTLVY